MANGPKTRGAATKRFKLTKTGKLMRRRAGTHHLLSKKTKSARRFSETTSEVTGSIKKNIKRALGV